ncbi:hypothetical protein D3C85_1179030 [compost metagenome]
MFDGQLAGLLLGQFLHGGGGLLAQHLLAHRRDQGVEVLAGEEHHELVAQHRHMHLERIQLSLVTRHQRNADLHVALAAVLAEVDHEGGGQLLVDGGLAGRLGGCGGFVLGGLGRLVATTEEEPGGAHRQRDGQQQRAPHQDDELQLALADRRRPALCRGLRLFLRHANNPSLSGISPPFQGNEQVLCQLAGQPAVGTCFRAADIPVSGVGCHGGCGNRSEK